VCAGLFEPCHSGPRLEKSFQPSLRPDPLGLLARVAFISVAGLVCSGLCLTQSDLAVDLLGIQRGWGKPSSRVSAIQLPTASPAFAPVQGMHEGSLGFGICQVNVIIEEHIQD
jgi:hypothetical protein